VIFRPERAWVGIGSDCSDLLVAATEVAILIADLLEIFFKALFTPLEFCHDAPADFGCSTASTRRRFGGCLTSSSCFRFKRACLLFASFSAFCRHFASSLACFWANFCAARSAFSRSSCAFLSFFASIRASFFSVPRGLSLPSG
jgi:hypothetical protein